MLSQLVPKFSNFCFFCKILQLEKFMGTDVNQIWQYCFQIPALKHQNETFLVVKWGIFGTQVKHFCSQIYSFFQWNFAIRQISRCWFCIWRYFFNFISKIPKWGILGQKCPIRHFGPRFRFFWLFTNFWNLTHLRVLISSMIIVFSKFFPKNNQIRCFWS